MVALSNTKTWTKTRVTGTGASNLIANKNLYIAIKNEMKNHGWSVAACCDSVSVVTGGPDLWVDYTDIVPALPGTDHSWIVLQNDNICSGYQICIDFAFSADSYCYTAYAYSTCLTPFTGGTTKNRPTSSTEAKLSILSNRIFNSTSGTSKSANVFTSSDHQCTHIFLCTGTTIAGLWIFDRLRNSPSWLTYPAVAMINSGTCVHADLDGIIENFFTSYLNGVSVYSGAATLMLGTQRVLTYAGACGDSGDVGGEFPCTPMWITSFTGAVPGVLGILYDLWWVHSTTITTGDYFPADGSKTQVIIGNMVQGNDGTVLYV